MTSKTKSDRLKRLISHGFFAPELPPCFVSRDLAKYRTFIWDQITNLPDEKKMPAYQKFISEPTWFYFPRFRKNDRRHGVLNPISYLALSKVIADNYVDLAKVTRRSKISTSPPLFDWQGSRAILRSSVDLRDDFRMDLSSRHEEFISADIQSFFHSIYTHAIPWAIHGKDWAKKNRNPKYYGNLIDLVCRNSQNGQTIGLPVGPDTSRLLAEVIASAIDCDLTQKLKVTGQNASRYVDDYTLGVKNGESGKNVIAQIRRSVADFELELNHEKTAIFSTSMRQGLGWKQAALQYIPRKDYSHSAFQRFFYEIEEMSTNNTETNIEKFSLQNARSSFIKAEDWKPIQNALINIYRRNPSTINIIAEIFILREKERGDVEKENIHHFLANRIPALAKENRTGEIIWLLYLAIRLDITLSEKYIAPLFEIENALIAILLVYSKSKSLIKGKIDERTWNKSLDERGLKSSMWLYAYESVVQNLNPTHKNHFIEVDPFFSSLYQKKVKFLDVNNGFSSLADTMKKRRSENHKISKLKEDFLTDFSIELDEFDEIEFYDLDDSIY